MKPSYNYPSQRDNDFYLRDDVNKNLSSKIDWEKLNACRLHLKVGFLSDITNNQGNRFIKGILYGDKKYLKNSNL